MHVSTLALNNSNIASIFDARAVFLKANELLRIDKREERFEVQIVGTQKAVTVDNDRFTLKCEATTETLEKTDLIIIPALTGDMMSATHNNRFFSDWIIRQYKLKNAEIASLCTGAFMLAFLGLLKNKKCTPTGSMQTNSGISTPTWK